MVRDTTMAVNPAAPPGNKRHKGDGMPPDGAMPGMPPQGRYPQQGYGGPPPPGYPMGWQGQYGSHGPPPPHGWQGAQGPPGMYPQRGGPPMTPERGGNWNGYPRGPHPGPPPNAGGKAQPPRGGPRNPMNTKGGKPTKSTGAGPDAPIPQQYGPGGWNPQWGPYGGPQGWHAGPPPHMQQPPYGQPNWGGASQTPPRARPRASPVVMGDGMMGPRGYPPGVCPPAGMDAPPPPGGEDMYMSRGTGMHMDDDQSQSVGGKSSDKDKGRGSYKCGRCGVPKKGHVCPYQPKVKRRSGEPAPEMKCAAVQVEMDEFMTLRRLNIRIQGFPESYVTDPNMADMVVGEPRPITSHPGMLPEQPMLGGPDPGRASPIQTSMELAPGPTLNEPTKG